MCAGNYSNSTGVCVIVCVQVIKDFQLMVVVCILVLVDVLVLTVWEFVDPLVIEVSNKTREKVVSIPTSLLDLSFTLEMRGGGRLLGTLFLIRSVLPIHSTLFGATLKP